MTAKMTLEEIEALAKDATPGPWIVVQHDAQTYGVQRRREGGFIVRGLSRKRERADANLIANAPRLLEICREQAAEIARLRQYTCEACADADSCDRVGRAANRQCSAFRVGTKK